MENQISLQQLGWKPFFQQQLTLEEWESCSMARIVGAQRSVVHLLSSLGRTTLPITPTMPALTVGDWLLLDSDGRFCRVLERFSVFSRKAAGTGIATQLIAANIDIVFVVSSMNQDFNLNRLERYLALANESGVMPVIVLSKADCCDDPADFVEQAQGLDKSLHVVPVNSLDAESVAVLREWCVTGNTVAFLGSSGVGKSTLINTLLGREIQRTSGIREDDDKGRHTTTGRSIHVLPDGGLLLDTPGIRELQLAGCEQGVEQTFAEIVELAAGCKFSDCKHETEPGCAVQAAIESGKLDARRLASYQKLIREQAFNQASLAQRRARSRQLGRYYRSVMASKRKK